MTKSKVEEFNHLITKWVYVCLKIFAKIWVKGKPFNFNWKTSEHSLSSFNCINKYMRMIELHEIQLAFCYYDKQMFSLLWRNHLFIGSKASSTLGCALGCSSPLCTGCLLCNINERWYWPLNVVGHDSNII